MPKGVASEKRCQHIDWAELGTKCQGSKWLAPQSAVQVHIVVFQNGKVMFGAGPDGGPEPLTFCGEWVGGSGETVTDAAGSAKDCRPVVTGDLMAGLRGTACSTT
jgi:hypothetical protein